MYIYITSTSGLNHKTKTIGIFPATCWYVNQQAQALILPRKKHHVEANNAATTCLEHFYIKYNGTTTK